MAKWHNQVWDQGLISFKVHSFDLYLCLPCGMQLSAGNLLGAKRIDVPSLMAAGKSKIERSM